MVGTVTVECVLKQLKCYWSTELTQILKTIREELRSVLRLIKEIRVQFNSYWNTEQLRIQWITQGRHRRRLQKIEVPVPLRG